MEILAIALWRSKELVFSLTEHKYRELCHKLCDCLERDLRSVAKEKKGYLALSRHLELLLALLRMRESENEACKTLLAPTKELTRQYAALVNEAVRLLRESNFVMQSRIILQVEKPEQFRNTPDLLYALRMYLTGDSGANTIWIARIDNDE